MPESVNLTIDGRQIAVKPNTLLVEAAAQAGILIPVYCYHPKLAPVGACRMCLVEVEGAPKLIASCTTPVREGMVVHTNNARVEKAREGVLEFLLIHHPLDCPVCDKGGECPLQDFTLKFGPSRSRFRYPKRHWDKPVKIGKNILLDRERCIMCFRCVRFCQEISGHEQLGVFKRGNSQEIGVFPGRPFDSQFSGNTIELCPVGALTGAPTRFFGRTWEVGHTPSICTGCANGCNIRVDTRFLSEVVRLWSRENRFTDDGWLCDKGRFGFDFVNKNRVVDPKIKNGNALEDTTWSRATAKAAALISEHARTESLGILASPRLTNEELWTLGKFARAALKTNNIDYNVRSTVSADLREAIRQAGLKPGRLTDLDSAAQIVVIGTDLSTQQPVTELRVKKAVFQRRASLVTLYTEEVELAGIADIHITYDSGEESKALEELAIGIKTATGHGDVYRQAGAILKSEAPKVLLAGWQAAASAGFADSLAKLGEVFGPDVPVIPIFEHCNSVGALDCGISPRLLPGGESVSEPSARRAFQETAGAEPPSHTGLSGIEILKAAADGKIKCLWILGEEPVSEADPELLRSAVLKVESVVFQGYSLPEAIGTPDVVLPVTTFAEMDGSFTSTDGRVQRLFKAIRPAGRSKPGWEVINALAQSMGFQYETRGADQIFDELAGFIPAYRGIKWRSLGSSGVFSGIQSADLPAEVA